MRKILPVIVAAFTFTSPAHAACGISKLLELKVNMRGERPLVDVGINGRTVPFIADSGAFYSAISPGTAAELGLRLEASRIQLRGIGGAAGRTNIARVKSLDLAGLALRNVDFIVGGSETGYAGVLGQNVLGIGDVEYDFGHGAIRIMRTRGCARNADLAYWAAAGQPVSRIDLEERSLRNPHTVGTVTVNGVRLRAIFDTGAGTSLMTLAAARRAGITPTSAGVRSAGLSRGFGQRMLATWIAPVASVKLGDEEIRQVKVRFGDSDLGLSADMLVGADFFLSHRVYVSNGARTMFFTYDGGPVFNTVPSRVVDAHGAVQVLPTSTDADPRDAAGFARRGAAKASRRDFNGGITDLDHAITIDPKNAQYLLLRGRMRASGGNLPGAFDDFDAAVALAPQDAELRLARAPTLLVRNRREDALADLSAADTAFAEEADQRLAMAALFQRLDRFEQAIRQYDLWIAAHPDDSRQPGALNGRCWTRALADRELPLALKDCDAALRRVKTASFFDSRGLVELRMGQYDRAIDDYTIAIRSNPKSAWSLLGRGLARTHKGDPAAKADIDAAVMIDPQLPARAKALGIS